MKYCKNCGKQMQDEDVFCKNCGTRALPVAKKQEFRPDNAVKAENAEGKEEQKQTFSQMNPADVGTDTKENLEQDVRAQINADTELNAQTNRKPETEIGTESQAETASKMAAKVVGNSETNPATNPETNPEIKLATKTEAEPAAKAGTEPAAETGTEPVAKTGTEPVVKAGTKPEVQTDGKPVAGAEKAVIQTAQPHGNESQQSVGSGSASGMKEVQAGRSDQTGTAVNQVKSSAGTVQRNMKAGAGTNASIGQEQGIWGNPGAQPEKKSGFSEFVSKVGRNKLIGAGVAVAVLILIVAVAVIMNMKKTINVNDYITVKFTGYNSVGKAEYELDEDGLTKAILKAQGKKVPDGDISLIGNAAAVEVMARVEDDTNLTCSFSQSSNLSNGDTVTLKVRESKSMAKSLGGVKLVCNSKKYTVSDLEAITEVDPFDYLNVTFSGTAPNARASLKNTADSSDDFLQKLYFDADKDSGLSKGDTFTVTVDVSKDRALQNGYIFTETSKVYTCDKVDEYVTDIKQVPDDKMTALKKEATDMIDSQFAQINSDYGVSYGELSFEGTYLLTPKNTSGYSSSYTLYMVYSANVSATGLGGTFGKSFSETKVYFPVCFRRVMLKADGSLSHESYLTVKGQTDLYYGWSSLFGYTDGAEMYKDLVTSESGNCICQADGNVAGFGKTY